VLKSVDPTDDPQVELQGKECMLFSSTGIANGSCSAIVTSTGMQTEIGKIQSQIQQVCGRARQAGGRLRWAGQGGGGEHCALCGSLLGWLAPAAAAAAAAATAAP
jgi:hypothetical protein